MRSLIGVVVLCHAAIVTAQQPSRRRPFSSTQQAVNAVRSATVTIAVVRPDGEGAGSGFVITPDGVIATAAHVIRGASMATVRLARGETFEVQGIIVLDEPRDFALLRIASFGLPTVVLGNSDSVEAGQRLLAFGAPLGLEATVSDGLLSSARLDGGTRLFQISVPVSPGSSGGPVATDDGRVIGLVVSGIQGGGAQNLNFALPINYLRGQIALASTKMPIPLAQVTYGPAGVAALPGLREPAAGDVPTRVNDSLGADWRILDGVQLRSESKRDKGIRDATLTEYALSRTPQGEQALERTSTEVLSQTQDIFSGRHAVTWYHADTRTVLGLGTAQRIEYYWRRTPMNNQVAPGAGTVQIDGGKVTMDTAGTSRTGTVPRGTLPVTLLGAMVAVLPDSLPRSVYIWFFIPSNFSSTIKAEPVRIDFGQPTQIKIPLARAGTRCSLKTLEEDTKDTTVDAVQMTATIGPERLSWPVLARRPHFKVEDVKCVRMP